MSDDVGIRELRQNLSVYLRRVAAGEHFIVTDHNRPVAQLGPPPAAEDEYERICREMGVRRAKGNWWELPTIPKEALVDGPSMMEILDELREERLP